MIPKVHLFLHTDSLAGKSMASYFGTYTFRSWRRQLCCGWRPRYQQCPVPGPPAGPSLLLRRSERHGSKRSKLPARVLLDCRREPVQQNKAAVAVAQAKRPSRHSGAPFVWHLGARGLPRRRPRLSGGRCLRHAQTVLLAGSTAAELEHIIEVEPWLCGRRVPVAALRLPQALSIGYFVRNNHTTNLRSPGARIHRRVRPARAALYCVLIKW